MKVGAPLRLPAAYAAHADRLAELARGIRGHLTEREVRFLILLGSVPTCAGEVLEIGSYQGKSTVILAKAAAFAGQSRVCAVDPLDLPAATDPTEIAPGALAGVFHANLRAYGISDAVEFHQMRSEDLGRSWDRPLRLLWIDGDHTWDGARTDFDTFARHLAPGGIVAFHDVLHRYEGPVRAMVERPLASPAFGPCGVVGSIGWAQYLGSEAAAARHAPARERLRRRLASMVPQAARGAPRNLFDKVLYQVRRSRVPHAMPDPADWLGGLAAAG